MEFSIKVVVLNRSYSTNTQPIWKRLNHVFTWYSRNLRDQYTALPLAEVLVTKYGVNGLYVIILSIFSTWKYLLTLRWIPLRECILNFKWHPIYRLTCNNDKFIPSRMDEISMFLTLKIVYFQLWFFIKVTSRFIAMGTTENSMRINHFCAKYFPYH